MLWFIPSVVSVVSAGSFIRLPKISNYFLFYRYLLFIYNIESKKVLPNLDEMNKQEKDKYYRKYFGERHKENNIHGYNDAVKFLDEQLKAGAITERIYELSKEYEQEFWYIKK